MEILCFAWLLTAMVVSLPAETRGNELQEHGCPSDELSKTPSRYAKELQNRVLRMIIFVRPSDRDWFVKKRYFQKRLLQWGFQRTDKDKNGLVDYKEFEATTKRWRLLVSSGCKRAFIEECDENQSKSLSLKEWLNCFNITPVCNKTCVRGHLDNVRCQCQCAQSVIQGRVVTSSGSPLRDVGILLVSSPYTEVARTNKSGHFSMIDRCENSSYSVIKSDFIPLQLEGGVQSNVHPLLIHLEDTEPAYISINPKSKMRIAGQSVNFTCEAEGTPPIKISWYHNGRRLQQVTSGSRSNLFIPNVNGVQGFYTCKATNEYGSEISTPAELKIKTEEILDTCNRTPSSDIIQLPPGCKVKDTGENTLDVGQCSGEPCSQRSKFSQTCGSKEDCCCGPRADDYQEIDVICGVWNFIKMVFYIVKECRCSTCLKRETLLKGDVVGGPNKDPVKNITVIFRKKVVDRTNEDGKFSFIIPDDVDRLTVTFQDPTDQLFDTTQTMAFQRGQTVFHRIVLQEEDPQVTFDSGEDLSVPLGHARDNMAVLEMSADNLLRKDGSPYKGKAKIRVSLTDPRNASDLFSAPGDFTTVDQSGSVQPLKTYGILRIKVQDQDNKQLDLAGNMKIYLDANKITLPSNSTGEMAPWLWWLDEKTGRWRQMGEMRPAYNPRTKRASGGRRFYIGDIQTDKISYINIDILWKRCYVRAQAFTMTDKGMQPDKGVVATLIGRNADQEQYYGYTKGVTDKHGIACIPAWCDSDVFLQSGKLSFNTNGGELVSHLNPDDTTLSKLSPELDASIIAGNESSSFKFTTKVTSQAGPIFGDDELNKCLDPDDNLVAFRFYMNKANIKLVSELNDFGSRPPGHPLSWYTTDPGKPNKEFKKCFLKITSENKKYLGQAPMVSVQSFTPTGKTRYGFSIKEQTATEEPSTRAAKGYRDIFSVSFACVEYRCSEKNKETIIVLTLLTYKCLFLKTIPGLRPEINPYIEKYGNVTNLPSRRSINFYAPVDISDGKLGLYTGPGKIAEERCKAGTVDDAGKGIEGINSKGPAVLAIGTIECPGWEEWPWWEPEGGAESPDNGEEEPSYDWRRIT
ncbi:hypothetical protein OS493_007382 [Desmophyllum pertusum]|uniref:Uncharacterized protein n=1 Tax=Desmophyllum pertusum TaxID=174260 RepID=A0A9W9Z370_9CNID|nr:hypothetical protein OS493_007382 [Desmophyllum pertusum]